jgi:glutaconate CoA-transferase subunit A
MATVLTLPEAIEQNVRDGDTVAMEGFTHLIPYAAGHEVIRQGRKNLTVVRMTPDLIYDQLIGMGCVGKMVFSWGGNPGVGSLHRFRDSVENGWPNRIDIEEHSHAAMANAYDAGAAGLPFAVLRAYRGVQLPEVNPNIKEIVCPFTGERLSAVRSIRLDVALIHAQKADRKGNVLLEGIVGVQKEAVLSAKRSVVTVEEIVDDLQPPSTNAVILPSWTVGAVVEVPGGAHPSYAHGYYKRDNAFYIAWDQIARDRDTFLAWMKQHVLDVDASAFAVYAKPKPGRGGSSKTRRAPAPARKAGAVKATGKKANVNKTPGMKAARKTGAVKAAKAVKAVKTARRASAPKRGSARRGGRTSR